MKSYFLFLNVFLFCFVCLLLLLFFFVVFFGGGGGAGRGLEMVTLYTTLNDCLEDQKICKGNL